MPWHVVVHHNKQNAEAQADKDIAQGDNIGPFDKIKEATRALKTAEI